MELGCSGFEVVSVPALDYLLLDVKYLARGVLSWFGKAENCTACLLFRGLMNRGL